MAKTPDDLDTVADTSAADLLAQVGFEAKEKRVEDSAGPASQKKNILGGLAVLALIWAITMFSVPEGKELDYKWYPAIVGMRAPPGPVIGYLYGDRFDLDGDAELDVETKTLTFFGIDGRRLAIRINCGSQKDCPERLSLSVDRPVGTEKPRAGVLPPTIEYYEDESDTPTRTFTRDFTISLKLKPTPEGGTTGRILTCLTTADDGFLGGTFQVVPPPSN